MAVLFGAVSSPFMLYSALYHHLQHHNPPLSHNIQTNLYVDNIVWVHETEQGTIQYYHQARAILSLIWDPGYQTAHNLITHKEHTTDLTVPANILGIHCNTDTDNISIIPKATSFNNTNITKHEVLQDSSKVFDPLGLTVPVTIHSKLLMQTVEPLDLNLNLVNNGNPYIVSEIKKLPQFCINRQYFTIIYDRQNVQLHLFADASTKAYSATAFFSLQQECSFIMAKAHFTQLKRPTLPHLELMVALTATHLAKFIADSLQLNDTPVIIWTDSQIVLYWIHSQKILRQFVSTWVNEINNVLPSACWKFCPTNDNPADLLTRGITSDQL